MRMRNRFALSTIALFLCMMVNVPPALCTDAEPVSGQPECQVPESRNRAETLEKKNAPNQNTAEKALLPLLDKLVISGGISAGYFQVTNAGPESDERNFLLSNVLVEISQKDKNAPLGFVIALGETTTPSILGSPESSTDLDIEYASLTLAPIPGGTVEIGLLQPNSGYECTYTFNNANTFLGALASQQPYNAYGARLSYEVKGVDLWAGYYRHRLDDEEYVVEESKANESWEVGASGTLSGTTFSLYHYHLESLRSLTGALIEHTLKNVTIAFNTDYWQWAGSQQSTHGDDSAFGVAVYVTPFFCKFSLPVRLEYIDQGQSGIFLENESTHRIYAITVSPTYRLRDNAYIRADVAYVRATDGFADDDGKPKSERIAFAIELGYTF